MSNLTDEEFAQKVSMIIGMPYKDVLERVRKKNAAPYKGDIEEKLDELVSAVRKKASVSLNSVEGARDFYSDLVALFQTELVVLVPSDLRKGFLMTLLESLEELQRIAENTSQLFNSEVRKRDEKA